MNKKIVVLAVALLGIAMLATPLVGMVYAKPPTLVSGEQSVTGYTPIADVPKGESANVLSTATLEVTWTGDIDGVATYTGILMVHNLPSFAINIHEKIYFPTVTVNGKSGSLTLQVSANLARGQDVFRWTIIDGTGELSNLHGNGIYWLDLVTMTDYYYEGQVHFDP
jgi:Protein of unknown function (DUF3224)